jgi:hypothetical protein
MVITYLINTYVYMKNYKAKQITYQMRVDAYNRRKKFHRQLTIYSIVALVILLIYSTL